MGVFWVNIAKFELNLRYRYCLKLIGKLRKKKEFWQQCCRNSTKIGERNIKSWREKEEEFRQRCYRNYSAQIPARSCVLCARVWSGKKKKKKAIFGNGIAKNGKKKNWMELWQCHCRKWEEKKNVVAEICEEILKNVLRSQYFYNTFTTNHGWLVIISSNLILTLRLFFNLIIIICNLKFVVKIL